jgi:hypothetical protein
VLLLFSYFWEPTASILSGVEDVLPKRRNIQHTNATKSQKTTYIRTIQFMVLKRCMEINLRKKNLETLKIMYCEECEKTIRWRCEHVLFSFRVYVDDWQTVKETHTCDLVRMWNTNTRT